MTPAVKAKLVIAAILCGIGAPAVLATIPEPSVLNVIGILFEVLYLLGVSYLAWAIRLQPLLRTLAIVLLAILMAPVSVYMSHLAFGKVDFHPAFMVQDLVFHLSAALLFLGVTWLVDRVVAHARRDRAAQRSLLRFPFG